VKPADLRGASRLAIDGVLGVTGIVEAMHRNIAGRAGPIGPALAGPTRGIAGLVYRSVRGVTRLVGGGLDATLPLLTPLLDAEADWPRREAVLSALNGVLGDHLAASNNPLAIAMTLRQGGAPLALERAALAAAAHAPSGKLLVLVHGLCMNDLQWRRQGHDHGAALAAELGHTPLYLHYNSGRHVATNGREFAELLERLLQAWPVPVQELVLVGHSMGGLVCRSACHHAARDAMQWLRRLDTMVFLGTPHHGAPLERAGSWVDAALEFSPYTAPFSRLGRIRSAGIQDLRHGRVADEGTPPHDGVRTPVPLPRGVRCCAVAASKQAHAPREAATRQQGDGLVPVRSALGQHDDPALRLRLPASRQWVGHGMNHFDLLSRREVFEQIRSWLG